jgi:hypothetical protein
MVLSILKILTGNSPVVLCHNPALSALNHPSATAANTSA